MSKKLEEYVVTIPDFPEPGIMFRDITSVIQDPDGLKLAVDGLVDLLRDVDFDVIVGPESRGFIFGAPLAYELHKPFVLIRKNTNFVRIHNRSSQDDRRFTGLDTGCVFWLLDTFCGQFFGRSAISMDTECVWRLLDTFCGQRACGRGG